ncbi:MAG: hypothetical protein ACI8TQ_001640 [Planctomycetota bacterium]|jgi:hypothetical protein
MTQLLSAIYRVPRSVLEWSPIWIPMAVSTQIVILGLRPAMQEQRHLENAGKELEARFDELTEERTALDLRLEAQRDPLYVEREQRALRDPNSTIR